MSAYGFLLILLLAIMTFAAFSRRLSMSVITMPIVFTGLGVAAHYSGAVMAEEAAGLTALHLLAQITLVLVLFSDASNVRIAQLRRSFRVPARMLLVAMPLAILLGAALAHWVSPDEPWGIAFLVAAILAPTDAALGQPVVADEAIPVELREGIAVESGLNDGLALPVVIIAALAAVEATGGVGTEGPNSLLQFGIAQITLGPLAGIVVGAAAAKLRDFAVSRDLVTASYQGIFFIAAAFMCFAFAEAIGGNGLIAAFVGGLTFGNLRSSQSEFVMRFMESEGQLFTMATFLVFGALLVPRGFEHASIQTAVLAAGFLTVVRILPVMLSLTGTGLGWQDKLFLGWFGPRGLASILFVLLVVESFPVEGVDEIVSCVVLTVMLSVLVHGASAYPITRAYARRSAAGETR